MNIIYQTLLHNELICIWILCCINQTINYESNHFLIQTHHASVNRMPILLSDTAHTYLFELLCNIFPSDSILSQVYLVLLKQPAVQTGVAKTQWAIQSNSQLNLGRWWEISPHYILLLIYPQTAAFKYNYLCYGTRCDYRGHLCRGLGWGSVEGRAGGAERASISAFPFWNSSVLNKQAMPQHALVHTWLICTGPLPRLPLPLCSEKEEQQNHTWSEFANVCSRLFLLIPNF